MGGPQVLVDFVQPDKLAERTVGGLRETLLTIGEGVETGMEVKLTRASAALMVTAACVALLAVHAFQLHHDYDVLSSRYAELQRSYEGLSLNYSRLEGDYGACPRGSPTSGRSMRG